MGIKTVKRTIVKGLMGKLTFVLYADTPVIQVSYGTGNPVEFIGREELRKLQTALNEMFGEEA